MKSKAIVIFGMALILAVLLAPGAFGDELKLNMPTLKIDDGCPCGPDCECGDACRCGEEGNEIPPGIMARKTSFLAGSSDWQDLEIDEGPTLADVVARLEAIEKKLESPVAAKAPLTKKVTRYRTELRETCVNGVCTTRSVRVPYTLEVPIDTPETAAGPQTATSGPTNLLGNPLLSNGDGTYTCPDCGRVHDSLSAGLMSSGVSGTLGATDAYLLGGPVNTRTSIRSRRVAAWAARPGLFGWRLRVARWFQ